MYVKQVKRKCSVRGCKNTECFAISQTREAGNTVIICKSCLGKALASLDEIDPKTKSNIPESDNTQIPPLFFNAKAFGKPEHIVPEDAAAVTPEEQTAPTEETTTADKTSGFVCPNCGRNFGTEQGLKTHLRFCKEKSDE